MYYRLEGYAVNTFVDYLRRVFRYNSQWTNNALEIVQFPSGSSELAFEQFFEDNEKYPIMTVMAQGGNFAPIAFNDFIDSYDDDEVPFGTRMQAGVTVDGSNVLAVQLPPVTAADTARAIRLVMAATGFETGDDPIVVNLYRNYQTAPVLVASASVPGTPFTAYDSQYAEFFPFVPLVDQDYWLTLRTTPGSEYSVGIDTSAPLLYQYPSGSTNASGSINGGIVLPAYWRYGTNFEGSCTIRCQAKNTTHEVYKLSELVGQYFLLAKQAQVSRLQGATDGLQLGAFQPDGPEALGEFLEKDIMLRNIRLGPVENRRRGENDIIYTIAVTVDYYTEWHEDFQAQPLHAITETIVAQNP